MTYESKCTPATVEPYCKDCGKYVETSVCKENGEQLPLGFNWCDAHNTAVAPYRKPCGMFVTKSSMDYTIKHDNGKPQIHLVPLEILRDIAKVREYGLKKYTDPDNWKRVEVIRYYDATMRHLIAMQGDLMSLDKESGLPHLWHVACNIAFMCDLLKEDEKK